MDFQSLLKSAGAESSLNQIGDMLGLDNAKTADVVSALAPALSRGLEKQKESVDGFAALQAALNTGNHQRYIEEPELMQSVATRIDGNSILGHLFGSKDVSRNTV